MEYGIFKKIVGFFALLILGACSTSGIIPAEMNLSLTNVTISQGVGVSEDARFSHELREEIRYEFSRAEAGKKLARIYMEVNELSYLRAGADGIQQKQSTMSTYTRLVDAITGDSMGEFPLKVIAISEDKYLDSPIARQLAEAELIELMARAALEKVYGKRRAIKIAENLPLHAREPYLVAVAEPYELKVEKRKKPPRRKSVVKTRPVVKAKPVIIAEPVVEEVIDEDVEELKKTDGEPKVISAPILPVQ